MADTQLPYKVFGSLLKDVQTSNLTEEERVQLMTKLRLYRNSSIISVVDRGPAASEIQLIKEAIEKDRKWLGL